MTVYKTLGKYLLIRVPIDITTVLYSQEIPIKIPYFLEKQILVGSHIYLENN